MDQHLKGRMKELGEAITKSLSDSEQISDVVSRIKDDGYDPFLVLEAIVGVSKKEKIRRTRNLLFPPYPWGLLSQHAG